MESKLQEYLTEIQAGMVVPKDKYNEFGGFPYRNAETILGVFKTVIKKNKLPAVITFDSEVFELLGRPYMRVYAVLEFADIAEPFKKPGIARIPDQKKGMSDEQILGSAFSYAAKYGLCSLFAIDDGTVDPDTHNPADNDTTKQPPAPQPPPNQPGPMGHLSPEMGGPSRQELEGIATSICHTVNGCTTVQAIREYYQDAKGSIEAMPEDIKKRIYAEFRGREDAISQGAA